MDIPQKIVLKFITKTA